MSFFPLCSSDPLLDLVRRTFRAQPIRVPEVRIVPLVVFAKHQDRFQFIGPLSDLVTAEARPSVGKLKPTSSKMSDISAQRSGEVKTTLGLQILDGFLQGFQIAATFPKVSAQFERVELVSFAFHDVTRRWIAPSALGGALSDQPFELDNAAVAGLSDGATVFIVDSVITSREFTMTAETSRASDFTVTVAEIEQLISASSNVTVRSASGRELTFTGPRPLPFAFTCQRAAFGRSGGEVRLEAYEGRAAFARPPTASEAPAPRSAVLTAHPALLEWDES